MVRPKQNYKLVCCFEIIDEIKSIETISVGGKIRDIMRLHKQYGHGRWRKLKGIAKVRLQEVEGTRIIIYRILHRKQSYR